MSRRSKKHNKDDVLSIFESSEGEFSGFECDEPIPSGASKKLKSVVKRVNENKNKSVTIEKSLPNNPLGASQSNNNDKNKKVPNVESSSGKKKNNEAVSNGTLNIQRALAQPGIGAIGELDARGHTIMPHTATALTQGVWADNPVNMDNLVISTTCQEGAENPQQ
ncbi:hypothetical protein DPMN_103989 [Dreissena polymorpha]|uniref:Uncharacterized protein n=1 Tax=Dreissena polymorpha TaxID=45954 RepID=A0A9D4H8W8_DREPO|nr:hypothetical protein DPMN_103989 [Dreissena polymorpha]